MEREHRRSSILKPQKPRNSPAEDEEAVVNKSRRVSFANSNLIKPFMHDSDRHTIWDTTYEEAINKTDSTQASQEQITSSDKENFDISNHRKTIHFNDEDVEISEDNAVSPIIHENQTIMCNEEMEYTAVLPIISQETVPLVTVEPSSSESLVSFARRTRMLNSTVTKPQAYETVCHQNVSEHVEKESLSLFGKNVTRIQSNKVSDNSCTMEFTSVFSKQIIEDQGVEHTIVAQDNVPLKTVEPLPRESLLNFARRTRTLDQSSTVTKPQGNESISHQNASKHLEQKSWPSFGKKTSCVQSNKASDNSCTMEFTGVFPTALIIEGAQTLEQSSHTNFGQPKSILEVANSLPSVEKNLNSISDEGGSESNNDNAAQPVVCKIQTMVCDQGDERTTVVQARVPLDIVERMPQESLVNFARQTRTIDHSSTVTKFQGNYSINHQNVSKHLEEKSLPSFAKKTSSVQSNKASDNSCTMEFTSVFPEVLIIEGAQTPEQSSNTNFAQSKSILDMSTRVPSVEKNLNSKNDEDGSDMKSNNDNAAQAVVCENQTIVCSQGVQHTTVVQDKVPLETVKPPPGESLVNFARRQRTLDQSSTLIKPQGNENISHQNASKHLEEKSLSSFAKKASCVQSNKASDNSCTMEFTSVFPEVLIIEGAQTLEQSSNTNCAQSKSILDMSTRVPSVEKNLNSKNDEDGSDMKSINDTAAQAVICENQTIVCGQGVEHTTVVQDRVPLETVKPPRGESLVNFARRQRTLDQSSTRIKPQENENINHQNASKHLEEKSLSSFAKKTSVQSNKASDNSCTMEFTSVYPEVLIIEGAQTLEQSSNTNFAQSKSILEMNNTMPPVEKNLNSKNDEDGSDMKSNNDTAAQALVCENQTIVCGQGVEHTTVVQDRVPLETVKPLCGESLVNFARRQRTLDQSSTVTKPQGNEIISYPNALKHLEEKSLSSFAKKTSVQSNKASDNSCTMEFTSVFPEVLIIEGAQTLEQSSNTNFAQSKSILEMTNRLPPVEKNLNSKNDEDGSDMKSNNDTAAQAVVCENQTIVCGQGVEHTTVVQDRVPLETVKPPRGESLVNFARRQRTLDQSSTHIKPQGNESISHQNASKHLEEKSLLSFGKKIACTELNKSSDNSCTEFTRVFPKALIIENQSDQHVTVAQDNLPLETVELLPGESLVNFARRTRTLDQSLTVIKPQGNESISHQNASKHLEEKSLLSFGKKTSCVQSNEVFDNSCTKEFTRPLIIENQGVEHTTVAQDGVPMEIVEHLRQESVVNFARRTRTLDQSSTVTKLQGNESISHQNASKHLEEKSLSSFGKKTSCAQSNKASDNSCTMEFTQVLEQSSSSNFARPKSFLEMAKRLPSVEKNLNSKSDDDGSESNNDIAAQPIVCKNQTIECNQGVEHTTVVQDRVPLETVEPLPQDSLVDFARWTRTLDQSSTVTKPQGNESIGHQNLSKHVEQEFLPSFAQKSSCIQSDNACTMEITKGLIIENPHSLKQPCSPNSAQPKKWILGITKGWPLCAVEKDMNSENDKDGLDLKSNNDNTALSMRNQTVVCEKEVEHTSTLPLPLITVEPPLEESPLKSTEQIGILDQSLTGVKPPEYKSIYNQDFSKPRERESSLSFVKKTSRAHSNRTCDGTMDFTKASIAETHELSSSSYYDNTSIMEYTEEVGMAEPLHQTQRPSFSLNIDRTSNKTALNLDVTSSILNTPSKHGLSLAPLSPCADDTQHLINYNLSGRKPSTEYTKILRGDYNPSFNSNMMVLSGFGTPNLPESLAPAETSGMWLTKVFEKDDSTILLADVENVLEASCADDGAEEPKKSKRKPFEVKEEDLVQFVPAEIDTDRSDGVTKMLSELCSQTDVLIKALPQSLKIDFTIKPATYDDSSSDSEFECSKVSGPLLSESSTLSEVNVTDKLKQRKDKNDMFLKINCTAPKTCVLEALFGTVILTVSYEEVTGSVLDIGIRTEIKADAEGITLYSLKVFNEKLSRDKLSAALGRDFDVLSLVDYVEMIGWENLDLLEEYEKLANYKLEMDQDFKVSFKIVDVDLTSVWRITVDFSKPIVTRDCVSIMATVGSNREQAFLKCMEGCPNDFSFFRTFINNIKTYLATLKR